MTDTIQFCEERAASYGAMRKSALTAIALDHAIDRMKSDTTTIETLQAQVEAKDAVLRWYAEQFCEHSTCFEGCGKLNSDDCAGCKARAALGQGEG